MGLSSSTAKGQLSKGSERIMDEISEHPVVMYSKNSCPWCDRAKKLFEEDGIAFIEKNLVEIAKGEADGGQNYVQGLMDLTKQRTVPQIFICGNFIGGYTELDQKRPYLQKMIEQCSLDGKSMNQKKVRASSKI